MQVLLEYLDIEPEKVRAVSLLPAVLTAAEDFAERYTGHQFERQDASTKVFRLPRLGRSRLRIPTARTISSATLDGLGLVYGLGYDHDYWDGRGMPLTHVQLLQQPSPYSQRLLALTGDWGWYPPPSDIVDGTYRLASRMFHERQATYSDSVVTAEGGVIQYFRQLPATVQAAFDLIRIRKVGIVQVAA